MKRIRISLLVACSAVVATLGAVGTGPATARTVKGPTVKLEQTSIGRILVDGSGYTLYIFTRDRRNKDNCAKASGCLGIWPALTTEGKPVAGANVRSSLLGTIKFHGNVRQVTYAGHPLYTYVFDSRRSIFYVGADQFGGRWLAVSAAGKGVD